MKVRSSIRRMCKHCRVVNRGKKRFVYCTESPKHKQRQGYHTFAVNESCSCDLDSLSMTAISSSLSSSSVLATSQLNDPFQSFFSMPTLRILEKETTNHSVTQPNVTYRPGIGLYSLYAK